MTLDLCRLFFKLVNNGIILKLQNLQNWYFHQRYWFILLIIIGKNDDHFSYFNMAATLLKIIIFGL